ncbi:MAG: hypothetical protein EAZ89_09610 [Bacteroidetes bacterium]|jgi:hypothetical protein|nr:MAG: hypothetical protein EAZ89_09610 [Bacteroidota bacterium]
MNRTPFIPAWLLFLFAAASPLWLSAQSTGSFTRVEIGPSLTNLDALNMALADRQLPELGGLMGAAGISHLRVHKHWALSGHMFNFMQRSLMGPNYEKSIVNFNYALLRAGYGWWNSDETVMLYPAIGLGGGLANVRTRRVGQGEPVPSWSGGALGDVSLNVSKFVPMPDGSGQVTEWGFSVGYMSIAGMGWNQKNFDPDTPVLRVSPQGFYIRLSLGMGRWR